jgi:hypothetical protein
MSEEGTGAGASNTEPGTENPPNSGETVIETPPGSAEPETEPKIDLVGEDFEFAVEEDVEVDADSLAGLKSFAIENKLSKDVTQSLLGHLISARSKAQEAQKSANEAAIAEAVKKIKADPDIGGSNYDKVQKAVDSIALKYGGEDFRKAVEAGGLKNEVLFLRFIRNLNSVLTEDETITTSQTKVSSDRPLTREEEAERFFKED